MSYRLDKIELPEWWVPGNLCEPLLKVAYSVAWVPKEVNVFYPDGEELAKKTCGAYIAFSSIPHPDPKYIGYVKLILAYNERRDCHVLKYELHPSLIVSELMLESLVNQMRYLLRQEGIRYCSDPMPGVKWRKIEVE